MILPDKEKKLLALALDAAAQPGEMVNAAVKLIEAWRKRDVHTEDFETPQQLVPVRRERKFSRPDYGLSIWPWPKNGDGHYKNQQFKNIPPTYLKNQLKWIKSDPERAKKFAVLAAEIEGFLAQ